MCVGSCNATGYCAHHLFSSIINVLQVSKNLEIDGHVTDFAVSIITCQMLRFHLLVFVAKSRYSLAVTLAWWLIVIALSY